MEDSTIQTVFIAIGIILALLVVAVVVALVQAYSSTVKEDVQEEFFDVGFVVVTKPEQLSLPLESTKRYLVVSELDMTGRTIKVPAGGVTITGNGVGISSLTSTSPYIFVSATGGCGGLRLVDLSLTATNGAVFDLTGVDFPTIEMLRVNFVSCASLGQITNFALGIETQTGRFFGEPTLTLTGTWAAYRQSVGAVHDLDANMTGAIFEAGAGFLMVSRFVTNTNCDLPANAAFADFGPTNFLVSSSMQIEGAIFTRAGASIAGVDVNLMPNLLHGDLEAAYTRSVGLSSTNVGGTIEIVTPAVTDIALQDTYYPINGTFSGTNLQHFSASVPSQLTYNGQFPVEFSYTFDFSIEGAPNTVLTMALMVYRGGVGPPEPVGSQTRVVNNNVGPSDFAFFSKLGHVHIFQGDYLQLEVLNATGDQNVTADAESYLIVQQT